MIKNSSKTKKTLRAIFIFLLLSVAFFLFVYGLYRLATSNEKLYNLLFMITVSILIIYKIIKNLIEKRAKNILTFLVKFFSYISIILFFVASVLITGAFIVRKNIGLAIISFIILIGVIIIVLRFKPFYFIKNFNFKKENY